MYLFIIKRMYKIYLIFIKNSSNNLEIAFFLFLIKFTVKNSELFEKVILNFFFV